MDNPQSSREQLLLGPQALEGELVLPAAARALVLFAHGSGSSRHSPRNLQVARILQRRSLGTLLFDLLTPDEAAQRARVFDIALLGQRLCDAIDDIDRRPALARLPIGLFGASTGAAAALLAAAARPQRVYAIVARGGRPDLALAALPGVRSPTLLIVGSADIEVLALNRLAMQHLDGAPAELQLVPGASHLFEEPGALAQVAELAARWFCTHLSLPAQPAGP